MPNRLLDAHTPGPWKIERVPIESRGGSNTAYKIGPMCVCLYDDWRAREAGISEAENTANALLIVAAPDMLAALQEIVQGKGAFSRDPLTHASNTIDNMKALARAAIEAATHA